MMNNFPLHVIPAPACNSYAVSIAGRKAGIYLNRFRVKRFDRHELTAQWHGMTRSTFTLALMIVLSIFLSFPAPVEAKRKLPAPKAAITSKSTASGVTVKVKFRADRKGVILNLGNLTSASNVTYDLIYDTRGTTQNAGGAVKITSNTANAEVIFGTCSTGVCRYDTGISNAKLKVFITLKNGRQIVKPFKLKV